MKLTVKMNNKTFTTMKKMILFIILLVMSLGCFAQTMKVQSAIADFNAQRYGRAKENIDAAVQDEKTKTEPKTWYYSGLIYAKLVELATSSESKDEKLFKKQKISEPVDTLAYRAKNSLMKSIEIEKTAKTQEFIQNAMQTLDFVSQYFIRQCYDLFNTQKYNEAINLSSEVAKMGDLTKSESGKIFSINAKYIIASAYKELKNNEKANEMYRELVRLKTGEMDVYLNLFAANLAEKDTTKAINVLKAGIKNIPDTTQGNFQVKSALAGLYLRMGNTEEGNKLVDDLITKTGNNFQKLNTLANELSTAGGELKAIELYNKSLQIKSEQIGANFGLGLIHFNKAADYVHMGNEFADQGKYSEADKHDAMALDEFKNAIPYFNKVLELDPKNFNSLSALRTIYLRLKPRATEDEKALYDTEYQKVDAVYQSLIKK
jgi:tetratricopeptide (TPR) repeat protein